MEVLCLTGDECKSDELWVPPKGVGKEGISNSSTNLVPCAIFEGNFLFLLWGDPVQTPPETQPLRVWFPLLKRGSSEVYCLRRGGVDREKKGKRMRKNRRVFDRHC